MRIAASLVKDDAAMAQRAEERLVRDEAEVSRALQRLSDAATLRAPEIAAAVGGTPDPLARCARGHRRRGGVQSTSPPR